MVLQGMAQNLKDTETEEIKLNEQPLRVIQIINLTESKDIPTRRVEEGFDIADNVILKPAEFQLQVEVEESDLAMIKQLYESKEPTRFECKLGIFENVIVRELHVTQGGSINTYRVTLSLKQILIAKSKTATVSLPQLQVTPSEEQSKGGYTATGVLDGWMAKYLNKYEKEKKKEKKEEEKKETLLDKVLGFVGWLCGWSQ